MEKVALKYNEILKQIVLRQNGVTSELMHKLSSGYETAYGLSISQINKIAVSFEKNNELALYCLNQPLREAKLMAFHLFDFNAIDNECSDKVVSEIINTELAEQAALNYFVQFDDKQHIAVKLLQHSNQFVKYCGLVFIRHSIVKSGIADFEPIDDILDELKQTNWKDNAFIKRGLSNVLIQIVSKNNLYESLVLHWILDYATINQNIADCLYQEVMLILETKND